MDKGEDLVDLPPGFRFHPTDEEIITHYLTKKVMNNRFSAVAIGEADLNKCEPWDLPKSARMGENESYFFCHKDRKYPTGMRTNRATETGYWKATGKDKEIYRGKGCLVGMKKTLVFYKGRAPKGEKTNWVMHEFRLEGKFPYYNLSKSAKDEWVVSRVYHKPAVTKKILMDDRFMINPFDDIDNLLDYPSLPPLMDPTFSGRPCSSFEPEFKPMNTSTPAMIMNNNVQNYPIPNNTLQTSINDILNPQIPPQNPNSAYKASEISSRLKNVIGSSKSLEDFADLGNIWDY